MDESKDIEERVEDLLQRLTFEEKCMLSAGEQNNSPPKIERLGIPHFSMTDGPHGVSPYKTGVGPNGIEIPTEEPGTATYFPTGTQLASTWNLDLMKKFGQSLAEETRAVGRVMQLGPAMNICRSPMNGRTFEYYSEDPYLSGELGAAAVSGMQSRRIAPCVKHYVANNFESNRFKVNAVIDERTLHEIYLEGFRKLVKQSDPWGVMSSYNKINGTYVSEHKEILKDILKEQWGFSGVVVSDWGATNRTTGIKGLVEAGLDIEMGSRNKYNIEQMKAMKEAGDFPEEDFDDNIRRILRAMIRVGLFDSPDKIPRGALNTPEHQATALQLAEEGMVLLKNENHMLPLSFEKVKKICVLGKHADLKFGRKQLGGGSSAVYPPYEITVREGIKRKCLGKAQLVETPAEADVCIVCVGLEHTHDFKGGDHEGSDHLRYSLGYFLPKLINNTVKQNKNTIVVCVNGSPFGMGKFINNVLAILEAWYGGMEVGTAVANILFGDVNPSGKLPISWPKQKKDIPNTLSFWDTIIPVQEVVYDEGIFIGYRYYDKPTTPQPEFCFGHGLSYTTYEYSNLTLSNTKIDESTPITVSFDVKNTGKMDGKEITQLYISNQCSSEPQPLKVLKRFEKVSLSAGESKRVEFTIELVDLKYYSAKVHDWVADAGQYEIIIGSSAQAIHLSQKLTH